MFTNRDNLHFNGTISWYVFWYVGKIRLLYQYNEHPYISTTNRTSPSVASAALPRFVCAIVLARMPGQSEDFAVFAGMHYTM